MATKKKAAKKNVTKKIKNSAGISNRLYTVEIPLIFVILIESIALLVGYLIIMYSV